MKKKIATIGLFLITIFLMGATIYIGSLLKDDKSTVTKIKKTKASAVTYHKEVNLLAYNSPSSIITISPSPTLIEDQPLPTVTTAPVTTITLSPVILTPTSLPALTSTPIPTSTTIPTPTEIILAYKSTNISITPEVTNSSYNISPTESTVYISSTPQPTKTQSLPESGWAQYTMIMLIIASVTIFLSFLY